LVRRDLVGGVRNRRGRGCGVLGDGSAGELALFIGFLACFLGFAAALLELFVPLRRVLPIGFDDGAALVNELRLPARLTGAETWTFEFEAARRALLTQLQAQSLFGYGLEDHRAATCAAGALVQYQRLSRILSTELGAKPAAESAALYYRLRQGHRV
jgi:hypothetical protein